MEKKLYSRNIFLKMSLKLQIPLNVHGVTEILERQDHVGCFNIEGVLKIGKTLNSRNILNRFVTDGGVADALKSRFGADKSPFRKDQ